MSKRGFGIAAAVPADLVAPLAEAAEAARYRTFWVNDTPGADGIAALVQAAGVTKAIRLGVGVIPLDRRSAEDIARQITTSGLPIERVVVGIGSGGKRHGSLSLIENGIRALREMAGCRVAVGALGPRMVQLAIDSADAVVLNWLTPEWAAKSLAAAGAIERTPRSEAFGYVRTGLPAAADRLQGEADRYSSFTAYARHFARMGVPAIETCASGSPDVIRRQLDAFDQVLDETVVRAITERETLDSYLAVLEAGRPVT